MPVLVHLASEADAQKMLKRGIRAGRGVYCLPVLQNYFVSHQWLRELKRRGVRTIVAVHFRLPDSEPVLAGHFNAQHESVTLGTAIRKLRNTAQPLGFEIIVPRAIASSEIRSVRSVPQVTGWRFSPTAKGRKPCGCSYCVRGEIKASRIRREDEPRPADGMPALLVRLRAAQSSSELQEALNRVTVKWRRNPKQLEFLMSHDDPDVLEMLVYGLGSFRGQAARDMLARLAAHPDDKVSRLAREELNGE
jgi:hypothetical protein